MSAQTAIAVLLPTIAVVVLIAATLAARRRGFKVGEDYTVVRCLEGHLFTTVWIP